MLNINQIIQQISIMVIPIIFAVVVHESAHGWVANKFGDPTAKQLGRITLNPIPHIDLFGTVILPIMLLVLGAGVPFAFAKPVPVNFRNLRRPKEDMAFVAAAGPISNICLAVLSTVIFKMIKSFGLLSVDSWFFLPLVGMMISSVKINVLLAIINLIPIPPADGGRIAVGLLPTKYAIPFSKIEPFGMMLLLIIMVFDPLGIFSALISPVFYNILKFLLI